MLCCSCRDGGGLFHPQLRYIFYVVLRQDGREELVQARHSSSVRGKKNEKSKIKRKAEWRPNWCMLRFFLCGRYLYYTSRCRVIKGGTLVDVGVQRYVQSVVRPSHRSNVHARSGHGSRRSTRNPCFC